MAGNKDENPDIAPKPTQAEFNYEIGVENNLPFAVPYADGMSASARADKELFEILREEGEDSGPTVSQLVAMRRMDGQAQALYRLLALPIRAALSKATFVPADGGEAEADFIDLQFNLPPASGGMSVTFHKFMGQLLQALFDGFSPFEQVYDYATYGPLKGKYVLRKLAYRQPNTITIIEGKDGHFNGFRQRAYRNGEAVDVHIPRDRAFYFAAQEEERKYYGVSFFQSAFYHYDKKVKMYYIAHLAAQRAAVGTRVGTIPNSATENQKRVFAQNLSNLAIAQWMMVPENFKVEMLKEGGSFPFLDYINHHNNQMSKSLLANFFDKDTGGGQGDAKLVSFGQPGDDMFILMLRAIMDDIANSINHYIIPQLIDWNFSGGKYPQFRWAELTDEQKALISGTFDKLASAQTTSPEFVRELEKKMADEMGLEIDWDAVEEREASEKQVQNLMQGIGPDGQPLPVDATGNSILPGQPNPDQDIKDFESKLGGGKGAPVGGPKVPEVKPKVKLSGDDDLLDMAHDLLELASADRVVRTDEGARRFGVAVGQEIPEGTEERPAASKVTVERLMSLKAQYDEFKAAGNVSETKKAMVMLRRAIFDYTGDWKTSTFISTLNSLNTPKE
jgi:hypothetical protein